MYFSCNLCSASYSLNKNLLKHQRAKHGIDNGRNARNYECDICSEKTTFKSKKKIIEHLGIFHSFSSKTARMNRNCRITCAICKIPFTRYTRMIEHLQAEHNKRSLSKEVRSFDSELEFQQWKDEIERKTFSFYRRVGSLKKQRYFICHRSYTPRLKKEEDRKRRLKSCGSRKIGYACPSHIIASIENEKSIRVVFYSSHLGHENELSAVNLSKSDRTVIAGKLDAGVDPNRILLDIRKTATTTNNLERLHLVEKKDIHNIRKEFRLDQDFKYYAEDTASVHIFVEEMKNGPVDENPVLFYKPFGEEVDSLSAADFMLIYMSHFQEHKLKTHPKIICINGTHGLNAYKYRLFTIVVIDEFNSCIPVSFCFSSREDTFAMKIFFGIIKRKVGIINPTIFMSDDDSVFYNAWKDTFGEVPYVLLCPWHVNKSWLQNLNKVGNVKKRNIVKKTLTVLRNELDIDIFHNQLNMFVTGLLNDDDTANFGIYFNTYYCHRPEKWAPAFWKHCGININMELESLHKNLKHNFLLGIRCRRLDRALHALINMVFSRFFLLIIKIAKKSNIKIDQINISHTKSNEISDDMIQEDELGNGKRYFVMSELDDQKYTVNEIYSQCPETVCQLICQKCAICIHLYQCSCFDNSIYLNICKHIHAVCRKQLCKIDENTDIDLLERSTPVESLMPYLSQLEDNSVNYEQLRSEMVTKTELITTLLKSADFKDLSIPIDKIEKKLDQIITDLRRHQILRTSTKC